MSYVIKHNDGEYLYGGFQGNLESPFDWGSNPKLAFRFENKEVAKAVLGMWGKELEIRVVHRVPKKSRRDEDLEW